MKAILKIEFSRAFKSRLFLISLVLGCTLGIVHIFTSVIPNVKWLADIILYGETPHSVFNKAMGFTVHSIESIIYVYTFPILAVLPFADSYYTDIKSGFVKNLFIRVSKGKYLLAKYASVFVTAGITVVLPLALNLFITSAILPSVLPEPYTAVFPIAYNGLWSGLYFSNPYLYVLLYFTLDFILGGLLACIALAVSFFVSNRFIVMLSPFVVYIFLHMVGGLTSFSKIDILAYVLPAQLAAGLTTPAVLACILVLAIPAIIFFSKGMKDETY